MWKYHMILSSRKIEKWERTYFAREKIDHTYFLFAIENFVLRKYTLTGNRENIW